MDKSTHQKPHFSVVFWHTNQIGEIIITISIVLFIVAIVEIIISLIPSQVPRKFQRNWFIKVLSFLKNVLPESAIIIMVGFIVGGFLWIPSLSFFKDSSVNINTDIIFWILLPLIIFKDGYFSDTDVFFNNFGAVITYAFLATGFFAIFFGLSLWGFGVLGVFNPLRLSVFMYLLFGSIISSVDPAAVLAIFSSLGIKESLYILVFGESIMNDGVSFVLFLTFQSLIGVSGITGNLVGIILAKLIYSSILGIVIGTTFGIIAAWITKFTQDVPLFDQVIVLVCAFASFFIAESCGASAILAIFFCGMLIGRYVEMNIGHDNRDSLRYAVSSFASMAEGVIFLFIGIYPVVFSHVWNGYFILLSLFLMQFYRFVFIVLLTRFVNLFRHKKIPWRDQFIVWFGGLRGAVAFMLALLLDFGEEYADERNALITTTIILILFTIFVQGTTIKPVLFFLKIPQRYDKEQTLMDLMSDEQTLTGNEFEVLEDVEELLLLSEDTTQTPHPKVTATMNKWIGEMKNYRSQLHNKIKNFRLRITPDSDTNEMREFAISKIQKMWKIVMENLTPEEFLYAAQDLFSAIDVVRNAVVEASKYGPVAKSIRESNFIFILHEAGIINSRGEVSRFAADENFLFHINRICNLEMIDKWIDMAEHSGPDDQSELHLLEILFYYLRSQRILEFKYLLRLTKVEFANTVFCMTLNLIKSGVESISYTPDAIYYALEKLMHRIDYFIQKLVRRNHFIREKKFMDAIQHQKKLDQMIKDLESEEFSRANLLVEKVLETKKKYPQIRLDKVIEFRTRERFEPKVGVKESEAFYKSAYGKVSPKLHYNSLF